MLKVLKLIRESFLFALKAVFINRLRTSLSLLGITIGIFAIISVFTIVDSLEMNIRNSVAALGSNTVYIDKWPWIEESGGEYRWWQYLNRPVPNIKEYEILKDKMVRADYVGFTVNTRVTAKYKDNRLEGVQAFGVTEEFVNIRDFEIIRGRYFSNFEMKMGRNMCVIGYTVAEKLFGNLNPLDKVISLEGYKTTVVGILAREGKDNFGDSMDEAVIVPVNHVRNFVNIRSESMNPTIWVKGAQNVSPEALMDEIRMRMRALRRIKPDAPDNFALNRSSMLENQLKQVFTTLNFAGWFIGLFSLLVGGFGIANIMFVSVKERTNIIGIQKALGAKRYFILLEFIYEAILLAIAGGLVGLLLVFAGTTIIRMITDFSVSLTSGNIIMGLIISSVIGFVAGLAPAWTASRLSPVEAINTSF